MRFASNPFLEQAMPDYRRVREGGGIYFFTVNR
jgi:hypothetical protein